MVLDASTHDRAKAGHVKHALMLAFATRGAGGSQAVPLSLLVSWGVRGRGFSLSDWVSIITHGVTSLSVMFSVKNTVWNVIGKGILP